MDCREAERFVQLRLDEEIEPVDCLQLDQHLEACLHCRGRADGERWLAHQVRSKLHEASRRSEALPPEELRARIIGASRAEEGSLRLPIGRLVAASVAIAMIVALTWSASSSQALLFEETVARHSSNLPPEVHAGPNDDVGRFFAKNLRYQVAVPRFREDDSPVKLVGARLSNISDRDVAYVMYDHRGARLSLFAYPSSDSNAQPDGFERKHVGDRDLLVGRRRGYNVVSWRDRDLTYSLVSDVDPGELMRLASAAHGE